MQESGKYKGNYGLHALSFVCFALMVFMPAKLQSQSWPIAGNTLGNLRYQSAEHTISIRNAGQLAPKWGFTTAGDVSATLTFQSHTIYFPDWAGNLYAVNADTGRMLWSHAVSAYNGQPSA